ncbi:hypothetical protein B0H14DRAFT_2720558 [Mycena olivaceomarginata]|nr:hypothetical protein B0H14DRAFT_2720558 [Mycena olivaceomarginata]
MWDLLPQKSELTRRPALTTAAPFTIYEEPAHRTLEAGGHVCNAISIHVEVLTLFSPPLLRPGFLTFTFSTCGTGRRNIYIKIQPNSLLMHVAGRSGASRMHMDGNLYSLEVQSRCAAVRMVRFLGQVCSPSLRSSNFWAAWNEVPRGPTLIRAHEHMPLAYTPELERRVDRVLLIGQIKHAGTNQQRSLNQTG